MGMLEMFAPPGGRLEDWFIRKVLGGEKYIEQFEHRTRNFAASQRETLNEIIRKNEGRFRASDFDSPACAPHTFSLTWHL